MRSLPKFLFPEEIVTDFTIHNLPYGVFKTSTLSPRIGVAIGDKVLDCKQLTEKKLLPECLASDSLNDFMSMGKNIWKTVRLSLKEYLSDTGSKSLKNYPEILQSALIPQKEVSMQLPAKIGDYTDFYASEQHARRIGTIFRGADNALLPNWHHIPIGYHGRASTIVPSGVNIKRPWGQVLGSNTVNQAPKPIWTPCRSLDYELELAFFVGPGTHMGDSISLKEAKNHIFGMVLMNDWSARDIQKWEYQPLGPFLAKSFGTTISPWVVTMEALEPFLVKGPKQVSPEPLPYLQHEADDKSALDINLKVYISSNESRKKLLDPTLVSACNFSLMYWSIFQQLTHHTSNGCSVNPGDLLATGTISGEENEDAGCLLEQTWGGKNPISLNSGEKRVYLQDGDAVSMTAVCEKDGIKIGFGSCEGQVLPAISG